MGVKWWWSKMMMMMTCFGDGGETFVNLVRLKKRSCYPFVFWCHFAWALLHEDGHCCWCCRMVYDLCRWNDHCLRTSDCC
jgi:hypothetical protein